MSDASFSRDEPDMPRGPGPLTGLRTAAAIGAFAASAYWALMTFLIGVSGTTAAMIVPFILIGLYAYRGYQLLKGNLTAASNLMWLHGIGGVISAYQIVLGIASPVLLGVKVAIHAFGLVTAIAVVSKARG